MHKAEDGRAFDFALHRGRIDAAPAHAICQPHPQVVSDAVGVTDGWLARTPTQTV